MTYSDDDIARELRRELHGSLVPFDPARAQHMIDEAIAASPTRRGLQSRWTLPLLASGAVAAVVGGVAGAAALHPDSKPAHPGGGPTVSVRPPQSTAVAPCPSTLPPAPPSSSSATSPTLAPSSVSATAPTDSPTGPPPVPTLACTYPAPTATTLPSAPPSLATTAPPTATTRPLGPPPMATSAPVPPQTTRPAAPSVAPTSGRG